MRGDFVKHPIWGIGVVVKVASAGQPADRQDVWFGERYGRRRQRKLRTVDVDDCELLPNPWYAIENPDPN